MSDTTTTQPAPRMPLQMDVEYRRSYGRRRERGRLKNISITGAFLEISETTELAPNDKVLITLMVSGRQRKIPARVIWHGDLGCGLKFNPTNNRDIQIVDDLMYFVENSRSSQREVLNNIFKVVS